MQIIIARLMWLVLPIFGRALTSNLLSANVGLVSAFLANVGISSLAFIIITSLQGGSLDSTPVGRNLLGFLNERNIRGPFASIFGFWMVVAAFLGKIFYICLWIVLSPILGATLYWVVKSLGFSVYYLQETYNLLPAEVKQYFVYLNTEIMLTLQYFLSPAIETGKEYGKYLLYWKAFLNFFGYMSNSLWFNNFFINYIDPLYLFCINTPYLGAVMVFGIKSFYFSLGIATAILPSFVTEFVGWLFSPNVFRAEWIGVTWGWFKTWFGW